MKSSSQSYKYLVFHKPYGVLCQFSKEQHDQVCLKDYLNVPVDVYPIGRLDKDSEGLLLLSNDPLLNTSILHPKNKVAKTYWVQIEGSPQLSQLQLLLKGIKVKIDGTEYKLRALSIKLLSQIPDFPARIPPIRVRKTIPDTWVEIQIDEGKNRQVRRMLSAIGFPVLRLVRVAIGKLQLAQLASGKWSELTLKEIQKLI